MIEAVHKKIHDTSNVIGAPEFNRLTAINFNARIKGVSKCIATKNQVENK